MDRKFLKVIAANGLVLTLGAAPALGSEWEYGVELYGLAADVKATSDAGEAVNANFDDIKRKETIHIWLPGLFVAVRNLLQISVNC